MLSSPVIIAVIRHRSWQTERWRKNSVFFTILLYINAPSSSRLPPDYHDDIIDRKPLFGFVGGPEVDVSKNARINISNCPIIIIII